MTLCRSCPFRGGGTGGLSAHVPARGVRSGVSIFSALGYLGAHSTPKGSHTAPLNFGFFIYSVAITCTLPNAIVVRLKMLISVELMFLGSLENWHIPYTPLNLRSDSAIS
mgnify:CR=1 FL=1